MKTDKMLHFLASYGITLTAMLFAGYLGAIVGVESLLEEADEPQD